MIIIYFYLHRSSLISIWVSWSFLEFFFYIHNCMTCELKQVYFSLSCTFFFIITMARNSMKCWIRVKRVKISGLITVLGETVKSFSLKCDIKPRYIQNSTYWMRVFFPNFILLFGIISRNILPNSSSRRFSVMYFPEVMRSLCIFSSFLWT